MSNETETTEIVNEEVQEEVVADHSETEVVETHEEVSHEVTLFAETIFHVGGFPVTNSLINSWVAVFIIVLFAFALKKKISRIPKGLQNGFEIIVDCFESLI